MYEVISEYVKSILACTENTLKEFNNLRIIRKEYFAVHGDHADRQKINEFSPKTKKNSDPIQYHLPRHDQIGKKKYFTLLSL
jgi:hypothetical protein